MLVRTSHAIVPTARSAISSAILRADRLRVALHALPLHGVTIFPLWPHAGGASRQSEPAKRIILQVKCGARAPLAILPGLVLHEQDGRYTREADAVLRDGAALTL